MKIAMVVIVLVAIMWVFSGALMADENTSTWHVPAGYWVAFDTWQPFAGPFTRLEFCNQVLAYLDAHMKNNFLQHCIYREPITMKLNEE